MATILNQNLDDDKQKTEVSTATSTPQQLSAQGAVSQAADTQPQGQAKGSGRFTSLNKYLTAQEPDKGQELAQKTIGQAKENVEEQTKMATSTADKLRQNVSQAGQQMKSSGEGLQQNIQQGIQQPGQVDVNQLGSQVSRFLGRGDGIQGDMFNQEQYMSELGRAKINQQKALQDVQAQRELLSSEQGRQQLLSQEVGRPRRFDISNYLMGQQGEVIQSGIGELGSLAEAQEGVGSQLGDLESQLGQLSVREAELQKMIAGTGTPDNRGLLGDLYGSQLSQVEQRQAEDLASRQDEVNKFNTAANFLLSGSDVSSLGDQSPFRDVGEVNAYLQNVMNIDPNQPMYNLAQNLGSQLSVSDLGASNVAQVGAMSTEDAQRLNALSQIAGMGTEFSPVELEEAVQFAGPDAWQNILNRSKDIASEKFASQSKYSPYRIYGEAGDVDVNQQILDSINQGMDVNQAVSSTISNMMDLQGSRYSDAEIKDRLRELYQNPYLDFDSQAASEAYNREMRRRNEFEQQMRQEYLKRLADQGFMTTDPRFQGK